MSEASVSIDRTSLGLDPLVISDDGAVYRLTADGVGYVVQSVRLVTAPDSVDVDGSEVVAYSRESTSLPLQFYVIGDSAATLDAAVVELEEALYRLSYPVTRTVKGVSRTYAGAPCALVPTRSAVDSGVAEANFDTFAVTIPFPNPNGA